MNRPSLDSRLGVMLPMSMSKIMTSRLYIYLDTGI